MTTYTTSCAGAPQAAPLVRFTAREVGQHAVHLTAVPVAVVQVGTAQK